MSFLPTDNLPTRDGDLFVLCDNAVRSRPKSGKESAGVNFNESVVRNGEKSTVGTGNLYLSNYAFKGDLTNPFRLTTGKYDDEKNRQYWNAYAIEGQPKLDIGDAPPPKEEWTGGNGNGGKPKLTTEQLDRAIDYAVQRSLKVSQDSEFKVTATDAFAKILGCAMFCDWASDEPAASNPVPDDIPF